MLMDCVPIQFDVFTQTRYEGNPLAICSIPEEQQGVSTESLQAIAREFNLSETLFIYEAAGPQATEPTWRVRIFLTYADRRGVNTEHVRCFKSHQR